MIASESTAATLDDTDTYPFFMRTCVSDVYHADVTIQLLLHQKWTRVSVFYEADDFGLGLKIQFETRLLQQYKYA